MLNRKKQRLVDPNRLLFQSRASRHGYSELFEIVASNRAHSVHLDIFLFLKNVYDVHSYYKNKTTVNIDAAKPDKRLTASFVIMANPDAKTTFSLGSHPFSV